jgi:hypothetical protein
VRVLQAAFPLPYFLELLNVPQGSMQEIQHFQEAQSAPDFNLAAKDGTH